MSRPKQIRTIVAPPIMQGYKPFGLSGNTMESITLLYDEYESIRLLDYQGMNQEQAAVQMGISRPTLTRIYEEARKSIAQAFVEGKMIQIVGGNVNFDRQWFRCKRCFKLICGMENHIKCRHCRSFGKDELEPINVR